MPVIYRGAVTGDGYYQALGFGPWDNALLGPIGYLSRIAALANVVLPPITDVAPGPAILAHLSNNQWLVACPDCMRDYQLAWDGGPKVYLCAYDWNAAVGGRWRRYAFPPARAAIEAAVEGVPQAQRNWLPGWSPARTQLEAGNAAPSPGEEYRHALRERALGRP